MTAVAENKIAPYRSPDVGKLSGQWDEDLMTVSQDLATATRQMVEAFARACAASKELERIAESTIDPQSSRAAFTSSASMDIAQRARWAQVDLGIGDGGDSDITVDNMGFLAKETLETRDIVAFLLQRYLPHEAETA